MNRGENRENGGQRDTLSPTFLKLFPPVVKHQIFDFQKILVGLADLKKPA